MASARLTLTLDVAPPPPPPPNVIGSALIGTPTADHVVTAGQAVSASVSVAGAVEVYALSPEAGRIDLPPAGGAIGFTPSVSGPFPVFAKDAAGGVVVRPMSVIVKNARPALDPGAGPTARTVRDGPLSDPSVWDKGGVPGWDDIATVAHDCGNDGRDFHCGRLLITGHVTGTAGAIHTSSVDNLGVGSLTLDARASTKALLMLHNRARHPNDSADFDRVVNFYGTGSLTVLGKPKTRWVRLSTAVFAGDKYLNLASPAVGWEVGNKVLLPDTRLSTNTAKHGDAARVTNSEVVIVRGISPDGLIVQLLSPVKFDHLPWYDTADTKGKLFPVACNLIANAGFLTSDPTDVPTRAHMRVSGRVRLEMRHWLVHGLGRTTTAPYSAAANRPDRNPLRIDGLVGPTGGIDPGHPSGDNYAYVIEDGVSIDPASDNPAIGGLTKSVVRWGVAISGSHFGKIAGNVATNWGGGGIVSIGQNDSQNHIQGNIIAALSVRTENENARNFPDLAYSGVPLWSLSLDNIVEGNVTFDTIRGQVIYSAVTALPALVRYPKFSGADTTISGQYVEKDPRLIPIRKWDDNESWCCNVGIMLWNVGASGYLSRPGHLPSTLRGNVFVHAFEQGYYNYTTTDVTFDSCRWLGHLERARTLQGAGTGIAYSDYAGQGMHFVNCEIRGFSIGYTVCPSIYSADGDDLFELADCVMQNVTNFNVQAIWSATHKATELGNRKLILRNVKQLAWANGAFGKHIVFDNTVKDANNIGTTLVSHDVVEAYDYKGQPGVNYRFYRDVQAAGAILPQSVAGISGFPPDTVRILGCPEAGLTNEQALAKYGVCRAGEITPIGAVAVGGVTGGLGVPI